MKNIILFGPPGVGKSTVIGYLKSTGCRAIDLEDVYPSSIRFQMPSMLSGVVLGGADLNPQRKYSNALKVLLTASQDLYDKRRAGRDAKQPNKSKQAHHDVATWLKGVKYDKVIDTSNKDVKYVADIVKGMLHQLPR